ncbi:MAG: DUF2089 domain-containing protein [Acidimicrobiales bacterium]
MTPERTHQHRPPRDCPVCGDRLAITRLGCPDCGSELAGVFEPCEFCALTKDDRALLRTFLRSRGNMKELERHLGVSYPTARARFDELLTRLGLPPTPAGERPAAPPPPRPDRAALLRAVAAGEIEVDEAAHQLGH